MIDLSINHSLINMQINEIFKRIDHADDHDYKKYEANYAWFQLFGMRKIVAMGGVLNFNLHTGNGSEQQKEYQQIMDGLDAALKKAELIYEEVHKESSG